jgi:hypothetical protein
VLRRTDLKARRSAGLRAGEKLAYFTNANTRTRIDDDKFTCWWRHRPQPSSDLQIAGWFVRPIPGDRTTKTTRSTAGSWKHFVLREKTATETEFSKIPGFYGAFELLHDNQDKNRYFLFDGPLRLAFFDLHLNSTDGDTVFALDLTGPRLVRLSPNWATHLPGELAFLHSRRTVTFPSRRAKKRRTAPISSAGTRS